MKSEIKNIPLSQIDDPMIAMRTNVDADDIDDLMASMRETGLLQPITVRRVGERYEVIAGHRRTRSARLLRWPTIEAKIIEADDDKTFLLRLVENLSRADVNPVDEATYIGDIAEKYNYTIEQLAEKLRRSPQWVAERLEIFQMPDYLQNALRLKKFPLGAGLWLGRISNEATRYQYVMWAMQNGVSVAGAKQWHDNLKATNFQMQTNDVEIRDEGGEVQRVRKTVDCAQCGKPVFLDEAESVWVHSRCPNE